MTAGQLVLIMVNMEAVRQWDQSRAERKAEAERIGMRLRWAREANRLTRVQLAADVGVHESLIRKLERGGCTPSIYLTLSLCHVLGISPDYLLWSSLERVSPTVRASLLQDHPKELDHPPGSPWSRSKRTIARSSARRD